MSHETHEEFKEAKDRTPLVWAGIVVLVALMLGALYLSGRPDPNMSTARASHILISFNPGDPADRERALRLINDLRDQIEGGASFARLARDYSDDPFSASRGGDLGYQRKGIYEERFEAYVWSAPVGVLSEVVETPHGFHLIRVEDRFIAEADRYEKELEERVRSGNE